MGEYILTTNGLTKQYGSNFANNGITIQLPRKEIIGFVGENGSGKTTLLRMLTGLVKPTSGTYTFDVNGLRIGAIVESPAYFAGMSGKDNILFHAKLCKCPPHRALEILQTVGLNPNDKTKVKNYSLGMRQRLGIGLALLGKPDFLILDEPTNGLDPQGIIGLRTFLRDLVEKEQITLLISSHLLSELSQLATYYLFISHGNIVESIYAADLHDKLGKTMFVKSENLTVETCEEMKQGGIIRDYTGVAPEWTLDGPFNYNALMKVFGTIDIQDVSTNYDSLESYYMRLTGANVS